MRAGRPLGATYSGLVVLGTLGTAAGLGLCAAMLADRPAMEPWVRRLLPVLAGLLFRRQGFGYVYDAGQYYYLATLAAVFGVAWGGGVARAICRKPAQDRAIDAHIRDRDREAARGAPLDPA